MFGIICTTAENYKVKLTAHPAKAPAVFILNFCLMYNSWLKVLLLGPEGFLALKLHLLNTLPRLLKGYSFISLSLTFIIVPMAIWVVAFSKQCQVFFITQRFAEQRNKHKKSTWHLLGSLHLWFVLSLWKRFKMYYYFKSPNGESSINIISLPSFMSGTSVGPLIRLLYPAN